MKTTDKTTALARRIAIGLLEGTLKLVEVKDEKEDDGEKDDKKKESCHGSRFSHEHSSRKSGVCH